MDRKLLMRALSLLLCLASVVSLFAGCAQTQPIASTTGETEGETVGETEGTTMPEIISVENADLSKGMYYKNPMLGDAADPHILKYGDTYYLYSTGNASLSVRSSKDLITWGPARIIFMATDTTWASKHMWAPEVYHYNGKFYLFYCAMPKENSTYNHCGIAVCDTPDGRFEPVGDDPIINFYFRTIDLSFFEDDDGRTYLFYSKDQAHNYVNGRKTSQTYGVEVSNDLTTLIGEPVLLSTPTYPWELQSDKTAHARWHEGPVVFKENGKYYLLYTANYFRDATYAVGYGVSDSPLGTYVKPEDGRILYAKGNEITGPGHCNVFRCEDEIYVVYHAHTVPNNNGDERSLYIDRLIIKEDGSLWINGPTNTKQPLPNGINGYYKYDGEVIFSGTPNVEAQDLSVLRDEIVTKDDSGYVALAESDSITLRLPQAQKMDAMWIYSAFASTQKVRTVDVLVNNQYLYEDIAFDGLGSDVVINFTTLPEGTLIEEVTLTFTKSVTAESAGISEIIFSMKQ